MHYTISLLSPLGYGQCPLFAETWISITRVCFVLSLVEIGHVIMDKKTFKFCQCILANHNYLLLEKCGILHLIKLESPSPEDALCHFGWNWPFESGEEAFLLISSIYLFAISQLSPLGKGRGSSFEQTWIPFSNEFDWTWPSRSGEGNETVKNV